MPNKPLPQFVVPMAAASVKEPFDSLDWIFEPKLDGYRAITVIDSTGKARLWSRNQSLTFRTQISDHSRRGQSIEAPLDNIGW
jgi:ATP-dependent DNA ligase